MSSPSRSCALRNPKRARTRAVKSARPAIARASTGCAVAGIGGPCCCNASSACSSARAVVAISGKPPARWMPHSVWLARTIASDGAACESNCSTDSSFDSVAMCDSRLVAEDPPERMRQRDRADHDVVGLGRFGLRRGRSGRRGRARRRAKAARTTPDRRASASSCGAMAADGCVLSATTRSIGFPGSIGAAGRTSIVSPGGSSSSVTSGESVIAAPSSGSSISSRSGRRGDDAPAATAARRTTASARRAGRHRRGRRPGRHPTAPPRPREPPR